MRFTPIGAVVLCFCAASPTAAERVDLPVFGSSLELAVVRAVDAETKLTSGSSGRALKIIARRGARWPGITLKPPGGQWDLSGFNRVAVDLKNLAAAPLEVHCRIDGAASDAGCHSLHGKILLEPGEENTLTVWLRRRAPPELAEKLVGMRGYPGGFRAKGGIEPSNVIRLVIYMSQPTADRAFEVRAVRAEGKANVVPEPPADRDNLFPLIDRYGQYIHARWPGKTYSDDDLQREKERERRELAARPGPADWDRYGGWKDGPKLAATGFFRTEKYRGKWWLVDPEGRLFWSHGVNCIGAGFGHTPLDGREHYFRGLPEEGSPLARFYGRGSGAPLGHYKGKYYRTYCFAGANRMRKYGEDYARRFNEIVHRRLRSWGMNTIGNWSSRGLCSMWQTPYVVSIGSGGRRLEGSRGHWGKFPDVFDHSFVRALAKRLDDLRDFSIGDPWCIGYFIDNELGWGDECSLAEATLASPPDQAAKNAFLDDLKAKFGSIESLNLCWNTEHASWESLLACRRPPEREKARDELAAFYARTAERYFRLCREAVNRAAGGQLYLGCRFAAAIDWKNHAALRAAAEHCDLLSFNPYCRGVAGQRLPSGVDMPVLIGEFHFGALDRGMFHPGLVPTADQNDRAVAYRRYIREALANPAVVGAHWFQFTDQPTTGRADGENYQIGLVDNCDRPYNELISAVRRMGATMYELRNDNSNEMPTTR